MGFSAESTIDTFSSFHHFFASEPGNSRRKSMSPSGVDGLSSATSSSSPAAAAKRFALFQRRPCAGWLTGFQSIAVVAVPPPPALRHVQCRPLVTPHRNDPPLPGAFAQATPSGWTSSHRPGSANRFCDRFLRAFPETAPGRDHRQKMSSRRSPRLIRW